MDMLTFKLLPKEFIVDLLRCTYTFSNFIEYKVPKFK